MSASRQFLTQGIDPALTGNWSAAQAADLTQLVQLAVPNVSAPPLGWLVTQATSPDVVTYPEYAYCLWCKPVSSTVQELYKWNGSAWQKISATAVIGASSIPLSAMATDLPSAGKILQYDVSGNLQPVTLASTLSDNSIQPIKFANATLGSRYIFMSDEVTGVFSRVLWSAVLEEYLTTEAVLPINRLSDTEGTGETNQVLYLTAPDGEFALGNVAALIPTSGLALDKLNWDATNVGKVPVVNSAGSVDFQTPSTIKTAVYWYGGPSGTVPQSVAAGSNVALQWNDTVDPFPILGTFTVSNSRFRFTESGTYLIQLMTPIGLTGYGLGKGRLYMFDYTAAAEVANATAPVVCFRNTDGEQGHYLSAAFMITVADVSHDYGFIFAAANTGSFTQGLSFAYINQAASLGSDERYQQMIVSKQF
jgi:hypothetical protein